MLEIYKRAIDSLVTRVVSWRTSVVGKYDDWKEQRFLKRHYVSSREQYNLVYDPGYNIRATNLQQVYHGYTRYHVLDDDRSWSYLNWIIPADINLIDQWCKQTLKHGYRVDMHRIVPTYHGWEINEIGGGDYYVFAFKDEKDYMWFTLKWAS